MPRCRNLAILMVSLIFCPPLSAQSDSTELAELFGQDVTYWAPFCDDTLADGTPASPMRPTWSSLDRRHWDNMGKSLPNYQELSENFTLEQTLQFLISTLTHLTAKIESAESRLETVDLAPQAVGFPGLDLIPQTEGHCLCVTKTFGNGNSACPVENLIDTVEEAFTRPFGGHEFGDIFEAFANEQLAATLADLEELFGTLDDYSAPGGPLDSLLSTDFTTIVTDELHEALDSLDPLPANCDLDAVADAAAMASQNAAANLLMDFEKDITELNDKLTGAQTKIRDLVDEAETIVAMFKQGSGVKLTDLAERIEQLIVEIEELVKDLQGAFEALESLWNIGRYSDLAEEAFDTVVTELSGQPAIEGCLDAIRDGEIPDYSFEDFEMALEATFGDLIEKGWEDIEQIIDEALQVVNDRLGGLGASFSLGFISAAVTQLETRLTEDLKECYQRATRPECWDHCEADGQADFLWLPVDYQQDPKKIAAGVASAGLFALDQMGWLDTIKAWVSSKAAEEGLTDSLGSALSAVGDLAESVKKALEKIKEILGDGFEYVDRFGEGHLLGAYTHLRPALHQCIPYAGHGAYAQLGSLGNDNFSLGARYTSHQLSEAHRVQFRSGGFGASAFGRELSLAPAVGLSAQIEGVKWWDPRNLFGLSINTMGWSEEDFERIDLANVLPDDEDLSSPVIRDLFPIRRDPDPENEEKIDWPRPEVNMSWENESTAVITFGLNLDFDFGPEEFFLPSIEIIPGVLNATPKYGYSAGIEWTHQTNLLRDRVLEKLNENLADSLSFKTELFDRDQHAFQAPDLSFDNRTEVFLEPFLGIDAFLGFRVWRIRIGAGAGIELAVNLEPGGQGGVLDVSRPLGEALLASNPPVDAPCEPEWEFEPVTTCSNQRIEGANADLACGPGDSDGSCCIQYSISGGETRYCLDGWTGLDQELCERLNFTSPDGDLSFLEGRLGSSRFERLIAEAVQLGPPFEATWSDEGCSNRECGAADVTTAGLDIAGISECANHGSCTFADGSVAYDIPFSECEELGIQAYREVAVGGEDRACALRLDGTPYCWGTWTQGPPAGSYRGLTVGKAHGCALKTDGSPVCWGENEQGQATPPEGVTFTALAAGEAFTCGLKSDQTVACWGEPEDLALDGTFTQISAGSDFLCGLTPEGRRLCSNDIVDDRGPCLDEACQAIVSVDDGVLVGYGSSDLGIAWNSEHRFCGRSLGGSIGPFSSLTLSEFTAFSPCGFCAAQNPEMQILCWTDEEMSSVQPVAPVVDLSGSIFSDNLCWVMRSRDIEEGGDIDCLENGPPEPGAKGTFSRYTCENGIDETLVDWSGSGCHPLQTGFPSACACSSDSDCADGESCSAEEGYCVASDNPVSCLASDDETCPAGRQFVDGACATACVDDTDCSGDLVCETGVCVPPHGIPYAESVAWNIQNGESPMHLIETYALSDFQATLLLKASLYVEASFKLFRKPRTWRLLDLNRAFDLGSTWKGRFQPGLEALYQHECEAPALDELAVTNRWPRSRTRFPFDGNFEAPGILRPRHCPDGGVCRYPDDAGSLPLFDDPIDYPTGNAGDVASLLAWCQDDLPEHAEKGLTPNTREELVKGITDSLAWGQAALTELWNQRQICVDGQLWDEWLTDLQPTANGPGNLQDAACVYEDPQTGTTHNFRCEDTTAELMRIWGCLDVDATAVAGVMARTFPELVLDSAAGRIFDLSSMFEPQIIEDPDYGTGEYLDYTVDNLVRKIRDVRVPGWPQLGARWLQAVEVCFAERFEDPAETACECSEDTDCDADFGERCREGRCERPVTRDSDGECLELDCSPQWIMASCPHVDMAVDAGPCCGDGVVQRSRRYSEDCDPGIDADCDASCRAQPSTGTCCAGDAGCREAVAASDCQGSWHPGQSCTDIAGCAPNVRGACCGSAGCSEDLRIDECADAAFFPQTTCADLDYCQPGPPGCAPHPSGLKAWWPFEPFRRNLTFENLGGHIGRINQATFVDARVGQGLVISGNGRQAELEHPEGTDFGTGDFSLAFWIRTTAGGGLRTLLDNRNRIRESGREELRGFTVFIFNGRLGLQLADGRYTNFVSTVMPADREWHHVGVTVDRDAAEGIRFFLDGRRVGRAFDPGRRAGSLSSGRNLLVGTNALGDGSNWLGTIDELHIFDRALSTAEMSRIATAGELGLCPCPDPLAPDVDYLTRNPELCSIISFTCDVGREAFFSECGCGCLGEPLCPEGSPRARASGLLYPSRDCAFATIDAEDEESLDSFHYRQACQEAHGGALPDTVLRAKVAGCRPATNGGSSVDVDVCCPRPSTLVHFRASGNNTPRGEIRATCGLESCRRTRDWPAMEEGCSLPCDVGETAELSCDTGGQSNREIVTIQIDGGPRLPCPEEACTQTVIADGAALDAACEFTD